MENLLRRTAAMALVFCLMCSGALGESFAFTLRAETYPEWYEPQSRDQIAGLAALLENMEISGTWADSGSSFDLNADISVGSGRTRTHTALHLYGTDSHWGLTSSLLGQEELMVSVASLLPFGMKARAYLDLPLEQPALLAPYTHTHALRAPKEVLAPLFPEQAGQTWIPRTEVNAMAQEFLRVCDEDPAFSLWLEATGTYSTAIGIANYIINMPPAMYGLAVIRTENRLTWDALGQFTILTLEHMDDDWKLAFRIPTVAQADGTVHTGGGMVSGSFTAELLGLNASLAFDLPVSVPIARPDFYLRAEVESQIFPEGSLSAMLEGTANGDHVTLRLTKNDSQPLLSAEAEITSWTPEQLPHWEAQDLTGMNILSATGDSIAELVRRAQEPLLTGVFDLLVAAPPEAVQSMMDLLEDLGVMDMVTDSLLDAPEY